MWLRSQDRSNRTLLTSFERATASPVMVLISSKYYRVPVCHSGNLIGRAVIEFCHNGPPVKNFISLGGPHAGTASVPLCGVSAHLAPSGYLKIPTVSIAFFFLHWTYKILSH
ncbi:hypothetical protein GW17_00015923 [Ensete ventricosum]|nr:hypothetical protein GW17_00015923 [Ensete ventricosum]